MSRKKGYFAEDLACKYLINQGFEIIERNFYSKYGEVDIIVSKDKTLHFVEVKSGKGFEPIYAITPKKIAKIIKTIEVFLSHYEVDMPYCIDALIYKDGNLEWVKNITL